jgi:hypothetical protein
MSILKSLKTVPLPTGSSPIMNRRMRLCNRLAEQKILVTQPNYLRRSTHFRGKGEERRQVEQVQKVSKWWTEQIDGSCVLKIKVGMSPVEIEPGKPGVLVASRDQLPEVIDMLIQAVRDGELDSALAKTRAIKRKTATASSAVKAAAADASSKRSAKVPA